MDENYETEVFLYKTLLSQKNVLLTAKQEVDQYRQTITFHKAGSTENLFYYNKLRSRTRNDNVTN